MRWSVVVEDSSANRANRCELPGAALNEDLSIHSLALDRTTLALRDFCRYVELVML